MPGNSPRPNRRRDGTKKGATKGTGGNRRKGLTGRGPTPKATDRTGHPAARKAASAQRRAEQTKNTPRTSPTRRAAAASDAPELLVGRNPVAEALRAGIPASTLYVALGLASDDRIAEAVRLAAGRGLPILEVSRAELDRLTGGVLHQGIGLQVPPYEYAEFGDILDSLADAPAPGLLVALDGVTDPRNLGAVVRSAAAFGANGVLMASRRSAGMTATAWRTSAGAAARLPVARVPNLVRALKDSQKAGLMVAGLDADALTSLDSFDTAADPVVLVIGSEGRGLSRLVGETCDVRLSIPMAGGTESLNASVAAAVTLAEVARRRRHTH